ncbi:IS481 family transposase [Streptomyces sp. NPDC048106]|uniref:IS481 family transposase n=1 Tax=Streptomyces sp. NPDC048106 TaxID=3155750 RepID=UPI003455574D
MDDVGLVEQPRQGRSVAHVAKELEVSRQCAHRWVARFRAEGWDGLHDRSSRPRTCPRRTAEHVEVAVLDARRTHRRGPDFLAAETGVPARTVSRILRRHKIPHLASCDPLTGQPIRAERRSPARYERARSGDLVDVKKIGRISDGGGWRAHGREAGKTYAQKQARIGYDYVHAAVDDHSRLAYAEIHADEKADTCADFLTRAAAFFAAHGIDHIERVITDNAWTYRKSTAFRQAVADLGAEQRFIRPHCPWTNGKVERFNRTLQTEWADDALAPWLTFYNTRRRHTALAGQPPISRLSPKS